MFVINFCGFLFFRGSKKYQCGSAVWLNVGSVEKGEIPNRGRADKDSWEDKIQRIAAESKARSEAIFFCFGRGGGGGGYTSLKLTVKAPQNDGFE